MPSPLSAKRFIATLIVGWIVLVNVQVYTLNIFSFPLSISIGDSLVSNTLLLLASLLILNITKYYMPTAYQFVGIIVSALVLSLLWLFISNSFLKIFYNDSIAYISFLKNSLPIRFVAAFVILLIVTTASVLWYNWQDRKKRITAKGGS